jgi:DNA-binding response OmpR family regulator
MNVMLTQLYVKLEQNGFGVDSYGDPFLALDNKTHLYDLVILDIHYLCDNKLDNMLGLDFYCM